MTEQEWQAYDATELIASYTGPKDNILIDQGAADNFLTGGQLLPGNFVEAARKAAHPVTYREQEGYTVSPTCTRPHAYSLADPVGSVFIYARASVRW